MKNLKTQWKRLPWDKKDSIYLWMICGSVAALFLVCVYVISNDYDAREDACKSFCVERDGVAHLSLSWTDYCVCNDGTSVPI